MLLKIIIKRSCLFLLLYLSLFVSASEKVLLNIHSVSESINEQYTLKQLQQLPQHEIQTKIPWTQETHIYKGPYLEDVLVLANAKGQALTLYALDQYQVSFDYMHIKEYKPILALQADGELLTIRTKGPVWLILPVDEHKELNAAIFHDYMVWQLVKVNVEEKNSAN